MVEAFFLIWKRAVWFHPMCNRVKVNHVEIVHLRNLLIIWENEHVPFCGLVITKQRSFPSAINLSLQYWIVLIWKMEGNMIVLFITFFCSEREIMSGELNHDAIIYHYHPIGLGNKEMLNRSTDIVKEILWCSFEKHAMIPGLSNCTLCNCVNPMWVWEPCWILLLCFRCDYLVLIDLFFHFNFLSKDKREKESFYQRYLYFFIDF